MLFNQYSFIFVSLAIIIVAGLILLRNKPTWRDFLAIGALIAGLVAAWVILHPVQTRLPGDAQKVQAQIGAGKPVLLEFQSPY